MKLYHKKTGREISCDSDQKKLMMNAGYTDKKPKVTEEREAKEKKAAGSSNKGVSKEEVSEAIAEVALSLADSVEAQITDAISKALEKAQESAEKSIRRLVKKESLRVSK